MVFPLLGTGKEQMSIRTQAQLPNVDVSQIKSVYFVGMKGVGMASLATMLVDSGRLIRGADVAASFVTDKLLQKAGISVDTFETANISGVDLVVYSGANQGRNNIVVQQAVQSGIPAVNLAQAVGLFSQAKTTVGTCGVGGKTTTSALLAWIFETAGQRPSYSVGVGNIPNLGRSGRWVEDTKWFIVEADEYVADPQEDRTPRFLYLQPSHALCTSLAFDHPDVYESLEDTKAAFFAFWRKIPTSGYLVANGDDAVLRQAVSEAQLSCQVVWVGESSENDFQIVDFSIEKGESHFSLISTTGEKLNFTLRVPGKHNVWNAAAAATLSIKLGVPWGSVQQAVSSFASTQRRFEFKGQTESGAICYDDYAHHPREIQAIAETLRLWFPEKRRVVAFQPHTFSRTKALFTEFVDALEALDSEVLLLPIFASAREAADASIRSEMLVDVLEERNVPVRFVPNQLELVQYFSGLPEGSVAVTLGAGDIYQVYDYLTFRAAPTIS